MTFARSFFLFFFIGLFLVACGQEHHADYLRFVQEQNEHFADPEQSPLPEGAVETFSEVNYYPFSSEHIVDAKWVRQTGNEPFEMATSTDRRPMYVKMGEFHFTMNGKDCVLSAYQNMDYVKKNPDAANDLFIPFNDMTNGETSYGGGRYMDVEMPASVEAKLNFNETYQPYCAYSHSYSCPVPPEENMLDIAIEAGVMDGWVKTK